MKRLTAQEIWSLQSYERLRDDFRRQVIAYKKMRRIDVGPWMTFIFEDRTSVKFQIQEILRAEKISTPEEVLATLESFNTMIPADGHLSATLMIAAASASEAQSRLSLLAGLQECVSFMVGNEAIPVAFTSNRDESQTLSAVQYLDFTFTQKTKQQLSLETCKLRVRHPNYAYEVTLPKEMTDSLQQDLYAQS